MAHIVTLTKNYFGVAIRFYSEKYGEQFLRVKEPQPAEISINLDLMIYIIKSTEYPANTIFIEMSGGNNSSIALHYKDQESMNIDYEKLLGVTTLT